MVVLSDSNCIALHSQSIIRIKNRELYFFKCLSCSPLCELLLPFGCVSGSSLFLFEEIPALLFTSSPKMEHVALHVGHPCIANYLELFIVHYGDQ